MTDKAAWDNALAFYRHSMISHDLLHDPHMQSIDTELAEDETLPKLVVNGADGALWDTLNSVAAIYRAHWWDKHDQANRSLLLEPCRWCSAMRPTLMKQLTTVYETRLAERSNSG